MTAELSQLKTDRDNIRRAIRSGVFQASVGGQATTFASMPNMRSVLNDINRQISVLSKTDERKPRASSITMTGGV